MDADAGPTMIVVMMMTVTLTTGAVVIIRIAVSLDNDGTAAALTPATTVFVTDHADAFDIIGNGRSAICERGGLSGADEKAGGADQKGSCKFVHNRLHECFSEPVTPLIAECSRKNS